MYLDISNPMAYHAALYVRLSRDDEREGPSQSITNQISLLKEFAKKHQLPVHDTYIDDGFSGTTFDRPAFKRMIRDIETKQVNMIITKDLSRLGRDYIMTGHYMERYFPEHKVRYISLLDGIDTGVESSANDITPFRAIMNDMYAKDISKKILSVKHSKQKRGLFIGGKPPYGYRAHPDGKSKFVIDEAVAPIVKRIFSMALSGTSCRQIASTLNQEQVPPPSVYAGVKTGRQGPYTGLWSSERISAMLQNEVYIGNMVQGRFKSVSYKSKKYIQLPRDQWTVVPHTHKPIIDQDTFQAVSEQIRSRNRTGHRSYDYLLKGLIFCHECGYPLGVMNCSRADGAENLHFVCRTYQRFTKSGVCTCHYNRVDEMTEAVMGRVMEVCQNYLNNSFLTSQAEQILQKRACEDPIKKEIRQLETSLRSLAANLDLMYEDKLSGILAPEDFQRIYASTKAQRDQMSQNLQVLQSRQTLSATGTTTPAELAEKFIHNAHGSRDLLTALVDRIELSEDRQIYIKFRFQSLNQI